MKSKRRVRRQRHAESGEFLWLMSLSDLMILLFIFFVVMFSLTHKKMKEADVKRVLAVLGNRKLPKSPMDDLQRKLRAWATEHHVTDQVRVEGKEDSVTL